MEDKLQPYRQPLVTATGIILGFILNFAAGFVKTDNGLSDFWAYVIAICILLGVISLIYVLYRTLKIYQDPNTATVYYHITLKYFIFGVSIAFVGVMVDMFGNFMGSYKSITFSIAPLVLTNPINH